jgi:hypothetical protein
MSKISYIFWLTLLILRLQGAPLSLADQPKLTIITYYEAEIPSNLGRDRVDGLISEYRGKSQI